VFKLAKTWKQFQFLLTTISNTLKDISNFSILLFLFIFTYTLLGLELFAYEVKFNPITKELDLSDTGEYPDSTFNSFWEAFVSVFIVLANDGWTKIYFDHYRASNSILASIFFISLVIVGQYILLNLFISILILNFEQTSISQDAYKKIKEVSTLKRIKKQLKRLKYRLNHSCAALCCCCRMQVIPESDMDKITEQIKLEAIKQKKMEDQQKKIVEW